MANRPILTADEPILRQRAKKVTSFDTSLHRLLEEMVETMRDAPGIGLAASWDVGLAHRGVVPVAVRGGLSGQGLLEQSGQELGQHLTRDASQHVGLVARTHTAPPRTATAASAAVRTSASMPDR